jgi:hypothetical protein
LEFFGHQAITLKAGSKMRFMMEWWAFFFVDPQFDSLTNPKEMLAALDKSIFLHFL